jgi:HSP20 family protein
MSKTADKLAMTQPAKAPETQATSAAPTAVEPARQTLASLWSDPFTELRRFTAEVDRAIGGLGFGRGFAFPSFEPFDLSKQVGEMAKAVWSPQIEVLEREGMIVLRADLPGLGKDDISIEIEGNVIAIKGERRTQSEEKKEKYFRSERSYGSFFRSFQLPDGADTSKAKATFKDGVLEVEVPAPAERPNTAQKLEILDATGEKSA